MFVLAKIQLLLTSVVLCSGILLTHHTDCGSLGTIHSIQLEPCHNEPCHITEHTTYTGTVNFTSGINSQTATNKATAEIVGAWPAFTVGQPNACGHGITCPVVKGETYTYTVSVTSPEFKSHARSVAKWMVEGDNTDEFIICFAFPVILGTQ
ncbi:NPC intracellular cholesterol transporter 2-like [Mya arenaria]|uniref:NPC intracellular cholesterol transporter 2-like n=1 Tax=Mya arenaria TaxID=6604 RepID=UPI0022E749E2|nr:NPC intracellular cholesterol transporter 2-like [Mya arenaria]